MLHHADIMNPTGNHDCGSGDITPNTTESEPTLFTDEAHEVSMGANCNLTQIPYTDHYSARKSKGWNGRINVADMGIRQ
eukprot:10874-Karenia_brevis.AAC.1